MFTSSHTNDQNLALLIPWWYHTTHLDMCFGLVEQSQCGVPTAVWSQRDEGLQPLQTQAEMCSSVGGDTIETGHSSSETLYNNYTWQKDEISRLMYYCPLLLILIKSDYNVSSLSNLISVVIVKANPPIWSIVITMALIHAWWAM